MRAAPAGGPFGRNLVLGLTGGYEAADLAPFIESLRSKGYAGDIALVTCDTSRATSAHLATRGVTEIAFDSMPLLDMSMNSAPRLKYLGFRTYSLRRRQDIVGQTSLSAPYGAIPAMARRDPPAPIRSSIVLPIHRLPMSAVYTMGREDQLGGKKLQILVRQSQIPDLVHRPATPYFAASHNLTPGCQLQRRPRHLFRHQHCRATRAQLRDGVGNLLDPDRCQPQERLIHQQKPRKRRHRSG